MPGLLGQTRPPEDAGAGELRASSDGRGEPRIKNCWPAEVDEPGGLVGARARRLARGKRGPESVWLPPQLPGTLTPGGLHAYGGEVGHGAPGFLVHSPRSTGPWVRGVSAGALPPSPGQRAGAKPLGGKAGVM